MRREWLLPIGVGLLALLLRAGTLLVWPFDGLYGQDAFAYYDYAIGPLRSALQNLQWPPPFYWPPGYPLLIALPALVVGSTPLIGQIVSVLAGSLAAVCAYALAREVTLLTHSGDDQQTRVQAWVPPLAGLLVALHPQLWQSSVVVMSDAAALAAATLGAWAAARYGRLGSAGGLWLAAGATAYAVLTRWTYAVAVVSIAGLAVGRLAATARTRPAVAAGQAGLALLLAGVVLTPVLPELFTGQAGGFAAYRWEPANFLRREFVAPDGLLRYRLPNGLYYGLLPIHTYYFTPLLGLFLLPGAWWVARRRSRALLWLAAWAVLVWGLLAGVALQNFRFGLAMLPPLATVAALGVAQSAAWLGPRWRGALAVLVAGGLALMGWGGANLTRTFIERKDGELALVAAVEAQAPAGARLLTFGLTLTFDHYSGLATYELYNLDKADLSELLAEPIPTLLLLDTANVEAQWQGRSPAVNYHWLRDEAGLDLVAEYPPFSLYRVRCLCP